MNMSFLKSGKKIAVLLMTVTIVFCCLFTAACKPREQVDEPIPSIPLDPEKTQIYFQVFNGGYGYRWAVNAALAYNETDDKFQIIVSANKDEYYVIKAGFEAGTQDIDIFLNSADYPEAAAKGWFEDLTDVYDSHPDGADKPALKDKIPAKDRDFLDSVFKKEGKYYGIPFCEGINGFVYDHDVFLNNCLLIGENGQLITSPAAKLSAGRDGVEGTFDDGHPRNIQEYELMLNAIIGANMSPYLWTNQFNYYLNPLYDELHAEYDGPDAFNLQYTFQGTYTKPSTGTQTVIDKEHGYLAFAQEGKLEALKFIQNYLGKTVYYHDACARSTSHTDAQQIFVYSAASPGAGGNKQAAFLYEGNWWENEARAKFNSLAQQGRSDYAYGKRDYRFMMLPKINAYEADKGYCVSTMDMMNIFAKKQTDSEKATAAERAAAIVRFLSFLMSDEQLRASTVEAGFFRPFAYSLTPSDKEAMSKFALNCFDLYNAGNVTLLREPLQYQSSETSYIAYGKGASKWSKNSSFARPIDSLMQNKNNGVAPSDAQTYYNEIQTYNQNNWGSVLTALNG
jgi:ABC-type glycerol-3-phosphate transport system substrate-binding protein